MANIDKIRIKGVDYNIVDAKAQSDIAAVSGSLENYVTGEQMSGYTYDKATIDRKVQDSGTFDPTQYYDKTAIDGKINGLSGAVDTVDGRVDSLEEELEDYFNGVSYNTGTKEIEFKNGEDVKAKLSAAPFIKDGMVENVEIEGGKLVITFNTDAGKEAIELELTDIFNAENYYTKNEADGKFGTLTEQQSLRSDVEDALGEIASLESDLQDKQDKLNGKYVSKIVADEESTAVTVTNSNFDGSVGTTEKVGFHTINGAGIVGGGYDFKLATKAELGNKLDTSVFESYTGSTASVLESKADKGESYTKAESDEKYAVKATVEGTTLVLG